MNVEFNGRGFSAEMFDAPKTEAKIDVVIPSFSLRDNGAFVLGVLASIVALANLPFGLFANVSADFMSQILTSSIGHFVSVLFSVSVIMLAGSVLLGVFSIISYVRSRKCTLDNIGFASAILSFAISITGLVLNIIALVTW